MVYIQIQFEQNCEPLDHISQNLTYNMNVNLPTLVLTPKCLVKSQYSCYDYEFFLNVLTKT
jgi:hypothetical protein